MKKYLIAIAFVVAGSSFAIASDLDRFIGFPNASGTVLFQVDGNGGVYSTAASTFTSTVNISGAVTQSGAVTLSGGATLSGTNTISGAFVLASAYELGVATPTAVGQIMRNSTYVVYIASGTSNCYDWVKVGGQ